MSNPLLTTADLPNYAAIQPQHVEPALDQALADNRFAIDQLLSAHTVYT